MHTGAMKLGRPSSYTPEMGLRICERLANGESLRAICRDAGMPDRVTVHRWIINDEGGFRNQYAHSKEIGMDEMAEECLAISDEPVGSLDNGATDNGAVAKQRLQVDTRKWFLSKIVPKKYGDRSAMELTGANGGPLEVTDTDRAARIAGIIAMAQSRQAGEDGTGEDGSDLV